MKRQFTVADAIIDPWAQILRVCCSAGWLGERKTPEAFRSACNRFIYVDNLMEDGADKENGEAVSPAAAKKEPPSKAVKIIARAIKDSDDSDDDGWVNLRVVGSRITGAAPDFNARTYGCPNLSTLVAKSGGFETRKEQGAAIHIRRKEAGREAAGKAAAGKGVVRCEGSTPIGKPSP